MSLAGIWTARGIDKLAAQAAGGPAITIDKIALGDGGGIVPAVLPSQTGLFKEVWRGLVNAVLVEAETPNAVTVEAVIPYSVGGFHIREWGLYDTDGDLMAVGPHAEFYKPLLAEGSGAELLERIQLPLANAGQVSLTISSEALATRKYVEQTATARAQEAVNAHDGDGTAHGGKIAALQKRKISVTAPLTGGGDLAADRTIGLNAASAATPHFVIQRDANGRAQVAAPVAAADIARKAEVDAAQTLFDELRKSWIGVPRLWRSTTLPAAHMWADGSLALFADWPELEAVYKGGGFAGMLLAYNDSAATIAANLGKWRPNAANPTGLFLPSLGGQFFRGWTPGKGSAGAWQTDTLRSHSHTYGSYQYTHGYISGQGVTPESGTTYVTGNTGGSETAPQHVWQPHCIYLGRPK